MAERRRGADLEEALMEAAWDELVRKGYGGMTMEAVADRAGTSRPVIARRWDGKASLAIAAIRSQMAKHPIEVPDRGDLRTELLEFIDLASQRAAGIAAAFTLFTSEYFTENSSKPKDLLKALIAGKAESFTRILDRAVERGQINRDRLSLPIQSLLPDLFRYHVIMHFAPPSISLRETWVDTMFLPLVR